MATAPKTTAAKKIPDFLIKEVLDGRPIYYQGFREVLAKKKKPDDIMGCSGLQAVIISYLLRIFYSKMDVSKLPMKLAVTSEKTKTFPRTSPSLIKLF